ncbi:unnamed protein product [Victoria cruziana]
MGASGTRRLMAASAAASGEVESPAGDGTSVGQHRQRPTYTSTICLAKRAKTSRRAEVQVGSKFSSSSRFLVYCTCEPRELCRLQSNHCRNCLVDVNFCVVIGIDICIKVFVEIFKSELNMGWGIAPDGD